MRRSPRWDVATVLGGYIVLGLVGGLVWWLLADPPAFTKGPDGSAMGELALGRRFEGDGWFVVVAAVAGLASGLAWTRWRARDPLLTTVLIALGSTLAGVVASWTGGLLGTGDIEAALAAAAVGERVPVALKVTAGAAYLVWPIAALAGALLVLWTPPPEDTVETPGSRVNGG